MSIVDVAKYQGEKITLRDDKKQKEYGEKYKDLLDYARDQLNKEHPDLFLGSLFDPTIQKEAHGYIKEYVKAWIKSFGLIKEIGSIEETTELIFNDILNLGVLRPILDEKGVTDIFADGPDKIYYDQDGKKVYSTVKFRDERDMLMVMKKLASAVGKPLNAQEPVVNAQIGKNRFNVTLGQEEKGLGSKHYIAIRVHRLESFQTEELVGAGQITQEAADFLKDMAQSKEIAGMFFGPTGSGKTTSLDTFIIAKLPPDERTFVIEDEPEMRAAQKYPDKNIIEMVVKKGNSEETTYSIARIIEEVALRAKPDRVFISEIRKGEDGEKFLYAMASGHKGWSTGHSDSAKGSIRRLAKMVMQTRPKAEIKEVEDDIYGLFDIIVYINVIKVNGKNVRKVTDIVELYQNLDGKNEFRPIFQYSRKEGLKRVGVISQSLAKKLEDQEINPERWLALE